MAQQTTVEWLIEQLETQAEVDYSFTNAHKLITLDYNIYNKLIEQAKQMEIEQNKKEKCWVIRNSAKHILCVHKTINDEQLKDYRKQGLYTDEYVLLY